MSEEFEKSEGTNVELISPQDGGVMFSVYDRGNDMCSPVFEAPNNAVAVQGFRLKTLRQLPDGYRKSDFSLYRLGVRAGLLIKLDDSPTVLARGTDEAEAEKPI